MNKGLQKHQVEKQLEKEGINEFDSESQVDENLSLKENLDKIEDEMGLSLRDKKPRNAKGGRERQEQFDMRQAKGRHEARSEAAQLADESKKAEKVFEAPLTENQFDKWANNPNLFDVKGVDY